MSVSTKSLAYQEHEKQVTLVNNVYKGVDTAINHLQKYNKEDKQDFDQRKDAATLNNFVYRVVNSVSDIIHRKPVDTEALENSAISLYLDTIDLTQDISEFAKDVTRNVERDGFTFILVDSYSYPQDVTNAADEIALGLRPYLVNVLRKNVLNYKLNDKQELERITIQETYIEEEDFVEEVKIQHRVFYYGGKVELYKDDKLVESYDLSWNDIPVVKVGKDDVPNLYDLAKINVNHMNRQSELNNYIRIGAAPVPVIHGSSDDGLTVIGVNQGIRFSGTPSESDFKWVEMTGSNAEMIREQLKLDEEAMLDISVSLVTSNQPRTATEVESDDIENESRLVDTASEVEEGLNKSLEFFAQFLNSTIGENKAKVNRDFDSNKLSTEEVAGYRNDYVSGIISWDKLMDILIEGEVYPEMDEKERTKEKALLVDTNVESV